MTRLTHPLRTTARLVVDLVTAVVMLGGLGLLLPGLLGLERYVITGASMSGTYDLGSIVFEEPVAQSRLAVGDVITYQPPRSAGVPGLVTHRIAAITADPQDGLPVFRTKGDANAKPDPWTFRASGPLPRVVFAVPHAGRVLIALADPGVRMLAVGLPAVAVALLAAVELVRVLSRTEAQPATGS